MEHQHSISKEQKHVGRHANGKGNYFKLAFSATVHCLVGCGLGEILGMVVGTWLNMTNISTMILAIILGAVLGLLFGMVPLLKAGYSVKIAMKQVLIAEGLSIAVMETFEVLVQVYTPGVMNAHLTDGLFWKGMLAGLVAGFIAAFPVNYFFVKKGIRHQHH